VRDLGNNQKARRFGGKVGCCNLPENISGKGCQKLLEKRRRRTPVFKRVLEDKFEVSENIRKYLIY
jgi:hypothetical protein